MNLNLWDVRKTSEPYQSQTIFPGLKGHLYNIYLEDRTDFVFNVDELGCAGQVVTGMFNGTFHVMDCLKKINHQYKINFKGESSPKIIKSKVLEMYDRGINYN